MFITKLPHLILLLCILTKTYGMVTSPLRMCDQLTCQIVLQLANNKMNFSIPISYINSNPYIVVCFRKRPIINDTDDRCTLDNINGDYDCLEISRGGSPVASSFNKFKTDATLSWLNVTKSVVTPEKDEGPSQFSFIIQTFISRNFVYDLTIGKRIDLANDANSKTAYFHTYVSQTQKVSANRLMQRNVECIQFYYRNMYNYNLIFYGGVVRSSNDTMFISLLSVLSDPTAVLNMWGGISFASKHAGRDMIGFSSLTGLAYDMYSLYSSAPFLDTNQITINGTEDLDTYASSSYYANNTFYFYLGLSRLYSTGDIVGDEIIRKKMGAQYCFAASYSSGTAPILPTDKNTEHPYVACWSPNIAVWQPFNNILGMFTILLIFILNL